MKKILSVIIAVLLLCNVYTYADESVVPQEPPTSETEQVPEISEEDAVDQEREEYDAEEEYTEEQPEQSTTEELPPVQDEIPPEDDTPRDDEQKDNSSHGILQSLDDIKILAPELLNGEVENGRELLLNEITYIKAKLKSNSIDTIVKNELIDYSKYGNVQPFIKDGTTLAPLRAVFEYLDADVLWNQENMSITVTKDNTLILLTIGNKTAMVNGVEKQLILAPELIDSYTVVPLRFIAESLQMNVDWHNPSKTILID